jgi:hypothetical protein
MMHVAAQNKYGFDMRVSARTMGCKPQRPFDLVLRRLLNELDAIFENHGEEARMSCTFRCALHRAVTLRHLA